MKEKPLPTYEDRASHAAQRLTDEYVRRWRRIKSNPETTALFEELMELSRRIPDAQVAVDVFEHVAAMRQYASRRLSEHQGSDPAQMIPMAMRYCCSITTEQEIASCRVS